MLSATAERLELFSLFSHVILFQSIYTGDIKTPKVGFSVSVKGMSAAPADT